MSVVNQAIPTPGAGNNQYVICKLQPPKNFAYVLMDIFVGLNAGSTSTTNNWSVMNYVIQDDSSGANRRFRIAGDLTTQGKGFLGSSAIFALKTWCLPAGCRPSLMIIPPRGAQPEVAITAYNETAADIAYEANVYARFLQYDIDQANYFAPNTPLLIR